MRTASSFPCSLPFPWRRELLPLSIPSPVLCELLPLPVVARASSPSHPLPGPRKLLPLPMAARAPSPFHAGAQSPLPWRASPALDLAVLGASTNLPPSPAVAGSTHRRTSRSPYSSPHSASPVSSKYRCSTIVHLTVSCVFSLVPKLEGALPQGVEAEQCHHDGAHHMLERMLQKG